ncbi:MAG: oxygen-dependent coproporphyrinogen oxidase [Thermonemataceae bacterium]
MTTAPINQTTISTWFKGLQARICQALEQEDGKATFQEDAWQREGGGGGRTRIIQQGNVLEKGGVAFSAVHGAITEVMQQKLKMPSGEFFATGVSIVLHPYSPHVPIIHMNVRYFELSQDDQIHQQWFGGGIDLTPIYIVPTQAKWFHQQLKQVCDQYHPDYYPQYKSWADDYFYLPHRKETRGVGGIFFDRLQPSDTNPLESCWHFVQAVGEAFAPTYIHLMQENKTKTFDEQAKAWQSLRRSRYVEFNLVYDAGTKFGLETNGRTESILMSMPPEAHWRYNYQPDKDTPEAHTLQHLKKEIDWINL